MWGVVIFSVLFFVFAVMTVVSSSKGYTHKAVFFGTLTTLHFFFALLSAGKVGFMTPRIAVGHCYEVLITVPIQDGGGTLVYAIDLKGNNGKADILDRYPLMGYKIEQVGKRTFLLPESTSVAQGTQGEIVLISEEGKAINVPPVVTSGK